MNCQDFQQQLDQSAGPNPVTSEAMARHAANCLNCAKHWALDRRLHRMLQDLPVPRPDAGFADRVFAVARRAQPRRRSPKMLRYALAASMMLTLGISLSLRQPTHNAIDVPLHVVELQPLAVQPVRLVFNSPKAVQDVTLHLALPEGVELAAYPGQRELSWQTNLQSGANLLELPVRMTGNGGVLTASLSLGDERRQFSVRLQPALRPSAENRSHLVLAMASRFCLRRNSEVISHV